MDPVEAWKREASSSYLYRVVAEVERDPIRRELFTKLAAEADHQAGMWAEAARQKGLTAPSPYVPTLGPRIMSALVRRLGIRAMLPALAAMKVRGLSTYGAAPPHHGPPASIDAIGQRHKSS